MEGKAGGTVGVKNALKYYFEELKGNITTENWT
jgi:hypothetical protein